MAREDITEMQGQRAKGKGQGAEGQIDEVWRREKMLANLNHRNRTTRGIVGRSVHEERRYCGSDE